MKMSITYKLFFSILGATSLAIFSLVLILRWNLDRGFYEYLKNLDQSRLEQMTVNLEDAYAEHGNWDFLRDNPRFWIGSLLNAHPEEAPSGNMRKSEIGKGIPPVPPGGPHGVRRSRWPFMVLDADRKPVYGNIEETLGVDFRPVLQEGKIVGYVGFVPPRQFLNPHQLRFLKQQKAGLILVTGGMVLAVMLFSLPLAKRLVRPIKAITAATGDLASGKYSVRVPVGSADELGQLARDFNTMAQSLEKNENARRQWVADISHELRTPVAVLRGELEALIDGIRKVTPDTVQSLHAEVMRLNRLVEDLYQLSLSDINALTFLKTELNLGDILAESVESYRAEFIQKGIEMNSTISGREAPVVFADHERLNQLFTNLLENSLRYTDPGGLLAVTLTMRDGQAVIEFQDTAPGVGTNDLGRLFERLYRVDPSRSRTSGGAGLGLAISKNIVEAHDGTISAHPSPLGGLLIRITLPVRKKA